MNEGFAETDARALWPVKKLDEVLKYMLAADQPMHRTFAEIQKEIPFESDSKDLNEILGKLEKDGYIESEIRESNLLREYRSTFDGRFFIIETGGYLKSVLKAYRDNKRLELVEIRQDRMAKRLFWINFFVAVGTVGLLIWEIVQHFLKKCS